MFWQVFGTHSMKTSRAYLTYHICTKPLRLLGSLTILPGKYAHGILFIYYLSIFYFFIVIFFIIYSLLFIYSFIHLFTYLFIHLLIYSSTYSFTYLFISVVWYRSILPMPLTFTSLALGITVKNMITETERSSGWQPWYSLETLKTSFNVSSEYQGCQPDHFSVSVIK